MCDSPQLFAMWYHKRKHMISGEKKWGMGGRGRQGKQTVCKALFKENFCFVLESSIKTDLSCFVVGHFLKSQGLYFAFFD